MCLSMCLCPQLNEGGCASFDLWLNYAFFSLYLLVEVLLDLDSHVTLLLIWLYRIIFSEFFPFFRWTRGFLLDFISFHHWTEVFSFINKPSHFFLVCKFRTQQYIDNSLSSSKINLFLHCHNLLSWIYYKFRFWARLLLAYHFQELPYQPPWY